MIAQAPIKTARPLAGRHVVVTRPAEQASQLSRLIAAAGGLPLLFPLLTISDVADPGPLAAIAGRLDEFDLAVFVSPNAVERGLPPILARRRWPAATAVATVGRGSERALVRHGLSGVIVPQQRSDSEALLEMPELQDMAGKRVLIFRGDGGRELLGDCLRERGASVEYLCCYLRCRPEGGMAALQQLWSSGQLDALILTSSEGLRNLYEMLDSDGRQLLSQTPLFVPHSRIAAEAGRLDLATVIVTPPGDEGLVQALSEYFSADKHGS